MPSTNIDHSPTAAADLVTQLHTTLGRALRGKDDVIRLALVALFAGGHLLIEDVPGVGKTTLAQALARALQCSFQRIQFTSDMLPSDVTGVSIFNPISQEFEFRSGPIFAHIVLADEINRTTPKTQSALLEAMNEAQVTVDNRTHPLPRPFMVIATQNPIEHQGTFPVPESQLDRFLMRIDIGYPPAESEREILRSFGAAEALDKMEPVMTSGELMEVQQAVRRVRVHEDLMTYLLAIVGETRRSDRLSLGVSPRGAVYLYRAAQALAFLDARDYCIPDDFKRLAIPVFAHRCVPSARRAGLLKGDTETEAVLREILEAVPAPL